MEVGEAFFRYVIDIDTSKFNAQGDMPVTRNKSNAISERLDPVYKFLRDDYIAIKKDIKIAVGELSKQYAAYCQGIDKKPKSRINFCAKLRDVQIEFKKSNGTNTYHVTYDN